MERDYALLYGDIITGHIKGELPLESLEFSDVLNASGSMRAVVPLNLETTSTINYADEIDALRPSLYWRLGESSGNLEPTISEGHYDNAQTLVDLKAEAAWLVDAEEYDSTNERLTDLSGNGNHLELNTGTYDKPVHLAYEGEQYMFLPGWDDMGSWVPMPTIIDHELDVRMDVDTENLIPLISDYTDWNYLAHQGTDNNNDCAWAIRQHKPTGRFQFIWSYDGTNFINTGYLDAPSFGIGRGRLGFTFTTDNGSDSQVKVYEQSSSLAQSSMELPYTDDSWTLVDTFTGVGTSSIYASSADLRLSDYMQFSGENAIMHSKLYRFTLSDSINGDFLLDFNAALVEAPLDWNVVGGFPDLSVGTTNAGVAEVTDPYGNLWSFYQYCTGSFPCAFVSDRSFQINGNVSCWSANDATVFNQELFTVVLTCRTNRELPSAASFAFHRDSYADGNSAGWYLMNTTAASTGYAALVGDGSDYAGSTFGSTATSHIGEIVTLAMIVDVANDTLQVLVNGDALNATSMTGQGFVGSLASATDLVFGTVPASGATTTYELFSSGIWQRALTQAELRQWHRQYVTQDQALVASGSVTSTAVGLIADDDNGALTASGAGTGTYVTPVANGVRLAQYLEGTLNVWFSGSDIPGASTGIAGRVGGPLIAITTSGYASIYDASSNTFTTGSTNICDGATHMLTATWNSGETGAYKLYVDGSLVGSGTHTYISSDDYSFTLFNAVPNTAPSIEGTIDEVTVWEGVRLSAGEIKDLYSDGMANPKTTTYNPIMSGDLEPGRTTIYVKKGSSLVWGGIIWTHRLSVETNEMEIAGEGFHSYFAKKAYVTATTEYIQQDQTTEIAAHLIDTWQALTGGNINVDTTLVEATDVLRDRTYYASELKNIGDAIEQLSELDDGFDFRYEPRFDGTGAIAVYFLTRYPATGRPTEFVFELGSNVEMLGYSVDGTTLANKVYVTGSGDGDDLPIGLASDATNIGVNYPLMIDVQSQSDVADTTLLNAHARLALTESLEPVRIPELSVYEVTEPKLGQYIVGDQVRVRGSYGYLNIDDTYRITAINVKVDADGSTDIALTLAPLSVFGG